MRNDGPFLNIAEQGDFFAQFVAHEDNPSGRGSRRAEYRRAAVL